MYPKEPGVYLLNGEPAEVFATYSHDDQIVGLLVQGRCEDVEDYPEDAWAAFKPDFSWAEGLEDMSLEVMLEKLQGMPDFGVCAMAWAWPDGGYMAGLVVTDRNCAQVQSLLGSDYLEQDRNAVWDISDGFKFGANAHDLTTKAAVMALIRKLKAKQK
jgi:hypothetical protein